MGNTIVHVGEDLYEKFQELVDSVRIEVSAYSPELNTAEFVFGLIKENVMRHQSREERLWVDTLISAASITHPDVWLLQERSL